MSRPIKIGLFVGGIGMVINACVATLLGLCGPVVALIAGGIAGYLVGSKVVGQSQATKDGALSGLVAGGLLLVGQFLGGVVALLLVQHMPVESSWLQVPQAGSSDSTFYYLGGLGAGVCFGIIDLALATLGGALAGRFSAQEAPLAPPVEEDFPAEEDFPS